MPRSCGRVRQSLRSRRSEPSSVCASAANHKSHDSTRGHRRRWHLQLQILQRFRELRPLLQPKRRRPFEPNSFLTVAAIQRNLSSVELQRRQRTRGECRKDPAGNTAKRSFDILAVFFLHRRPRVALFVGRHLAATSLPRETEVWERHGYRLFMELAQPTGNGEGTTGGTGVLCATRASWLGRSCRQRWNPFLTRP